MQGNAHGLPFNPISAHYQNLFGEKVYKIPVTVVDNCPNRMGLKGMVTCSFCDVWGSAAHSESFTMPLEEQIEKYSAGLQKKFKSNSFLVYFQAYTNSFTKLAHLRQNFEIALKYPFVKGLVIGTRPDCISKGVIDLWNEYNERTHVAVELGVQSFYNHHLEFMTRGHSAEDSIAAIHKIAKESTVDLGIHLIFGSPNETLAEVQKTAEICNGLPITNVKLHNMHILKNTALEKLWDRGEFKPLELPEYSEMVRAFIEPLDPRLHLHRLAAYSSRWDELIAPKWTASKMGTHQQIIDYLRTTNSYQGKTFVPLIDRSLTGVKENQKSTFLQT